MQVILSIAFIGIFLSFSNSVLGKDSAIATYVDEINKLIPDNKKKLNTVKFLKDSDNWSKLEKAVSTDPEGTFKVVMKFLYLLPVGVDKSNSMFEGSSPPFKHQSAIQFGENFLLFLETGKPLIKLVSETEGVLKKETMDHFKPVDFVEQLAKTLTAYDVVYKNPAAKKEFKNPKPIGDVVPQLSLALKEFTSTKWDKEFYEKLTKAADDKPYETNPLWYGVAAVIIILLIAGLAIFLVLTRRKRQASNSA
jgi:hypothetical protein